MTVFRWISAVLLLWAFALSAQTPAVPLSPARKRIALAEAAIEKHPSDPQSCNDLASALVGRARETSDPAYYRQAEEALGKSFGLAPGNYAGRKIQVRILIGRHEFARALDVAKELNKMVPDDFEVYGLVADAAIELGNYQEAEKAAQWNLNLRPPTSAGIARGARLRELFGDIDGALEFLNLALKMVNSSEVADRALILTQTALLMLTTGKVESAEKLLRQALDIFPGYHFALANLSRVRSVQQKHEEAIELLHGEWQAVRHPQNLYALAGALEQAGRLEEAKRTYAEFENEARGRIESPDNANRELIFYYSGPARKPAEALRIARLEIVRRHDAHMLDAYAWALYANGEYDEARKQIESALAVGIRDADFFYHAGSIRAKLNDRTAAERHWRQSLDINPLSTSAKPVREALAKLASLGLPAWR